MNVKHLYLNSSITVAFVNLNEVVSETLLKRVNARNDRSGFGYG